MQNNKEKMRSIFQTEDSEKPKDVGGEYDGSHIDEFFRRFI